MKRRSKIVFLSLLSCLAAFWIFLCPAFASEIILIGEVNYSYQIVADGQIYEVADTVLGDDLVINYIAEKVEVTGTVEEKGGMKIITVKSFKVVPEKK